MSDQFSGNQFLVTPVSFGRGSHLLGNCSRNLKLDLSVGTFCKEKSRATLLSLLYGKKIFIVLRSIVERFSLEDAQTHRESNKGITKQY